MNITPEARQAARKEFDDIQHSGVEAGIHIQRLLDSQAEKFRPIVEALKVLERCDCATGTLSGLHSPQCGLVVARPALALARELMKEDK